MQKGYIFRMYPEFIPYRTASRQRVKIFPKAQAVAAVKAIPGAAAMSMRVSPLPRRKYITTRARAVPTGPEKI